MAARVSARRAGVTAAGEAAVDGQGEQEREEERRRRQVVLADVAHEHHGEEGGRDGQRERQRGDGGRGGVGRAALTQGGQHEPGDGEGGGGSGGEDGVVAEVGGVPEREGGHRGEQGPGEHREALGPGERAGDAVGGVGEVGGAARGLADDEEDEDGQDHGGQRRGGAAEGVGGGGAQDGGAEDEDAGASEGGQGGLFGGQGDEGEGEDGEVAGHGRAVAAQERGQREDGGPAAQRVAPHGADGVPLVLHADDGLVEGEQRRGEGGGEAGGAEPGREADEREQAEGEGQRVEGAERGHAVAGGVQPQGEAAAEHEDGRPVGLVGLEGAAEEAAVADPAADEVDAVPVVGDGRGSADGEVGGERQERRGEPEQAGRGRGGHAGALVPRMTQLTKRRGKVAPRRSVRRSRGSTGR
jgi:hypothetical protein